MASFLNTVNRTTGARRFYMDGVRISRSQWDALMPDFPVQSCFVTTVTPTHYHQRHEGSR